MEPIQYTIRGVPTRVDQLARQRAQERNTSLNAVLLEALTRGIGAGADEVMYHDLDGLVGTWIEDPAFDTAMEACEAVDEDLWRFRHLHQRHRARAVAALRLGRQLGHV